MSALKKLIAVICVVSLLTSPVFSQETPEKAKEEMEKHNQNIEDYLNSLGGK